MKPLTLDHVALWVADRDAIATVLTEQLGLREIERTERFTLLGADARRGKITLFTAEVPRERGAPQQWARIRLQWFDGSKRAWRVVRSSGGDAGWARFGIGTRLVQGGTTFTFPLPTTSNSSRAPRARSDAFAV